MSCRFQMCSFGSYRTPAVFLVLASCYINGHNVVRLWTARDRTTGSSLFTSVSISEKLMIVSNVQMNHREDLAGRLDGGGLGDNEKQTRE
jgi:hypothetical protein